MWFRHHLRTQPPLQARWWQEWQRRVSGLEFFHHQQAGRQGSFLGAGSPDPELGTAVAREFVLGGWFWTQLRRRQHLMIVRANKLEVFAGHRAKASVTLSRRATATLLPLSLGLFHCL